MMLLSVLDHRTATLIRLAGLALIGWSVFASHHEPGTSGRGLVVSVLLALAVLAWLVWTARSVSGATEPGELLVLAVAGGLLVGACPDSAASAFVFVAVVAAGARTAPARAVPVLVAGALALCASTLIYHQSAVGLLAYVLGLTAALLGTTNARQRIARAEQAELLLAQTQRSHEEQLRAARLEESTRIAREIHDVLAHALAGLTIQLEATAALLEQGADRDAVLTRIRRAHALARDGLRETRRAVGALRGETVPAPARIQALVEEHGPAAELTMDGDPARLSGATGETVMRVVQEALTNVRKHAPGAPVSVAVDAGAGPQDGVTVVVDNTAAPAPVAVPAGGLAHSGGGYGVPGMRERAQALGGTLDAGATGDGWRVELHLPPAGGVPELHLPPAGGVPEPGS